MDVLVVRSLPMIPSALAAARIASVSTRPTPGDAEAADRLMSLMRPSARKRRRVQIASSLESVPSPSSCFPKFSGNVLCGTRAPHIRGVDLSRQRPFAKATLRRTTGRHRVLCRALTSEDHSCQFFLFQPLPMPKEPEGYRACQVRGGRGDDHLCSRCASDGGGIAQIAFEVGEYTYANGGELARTCLSRNAPFPAMSSSASSVSSPAARCASTVEKCCCQPPQGKLHRQTMSGPCLRRTDQPLHCCRSSGRRDRDAVRREPSQWAARQSCGNDGQRFPPYLLPRIFERGEPFRSMATSR